MESFDTGHKPIVYRIDAHDEIVFANDAFRSFVQANGAPGVAETTIGTSLWSAVAGDETSLLWRELIARVLAESRASGSGSRRSKRSVTRCVRRAPQRFARLPGCRPRSVYSDLQATTVISTSMSLTRCAPTVVRTGRGSGKCAA